MKDQHSTSNGDKEPVRPRSIPADFIWDPEFKAWFAPGEPSTYDAEAFRRNLEKILAEGGRGGLITVDELRAAGALDVPTAWRKSLGEDRDLFSELMGEDENPEKQPPE